MLTSPNDNGMTVVDTGSSVDGISVGRDGTDIQAGVSHLSRKNDAVAAETRARLSDVEATAVQVALFRSLAASRLLRSNGQPYYDASYDAAIVSACSPTLAETELLSRQSHMLPFMAIRTAEIDHHIMQSLQRAEPAGHGKGRQEMYEHERFPVAAADCTASSAGAAAAAAATVVRQVVLLGAGLDARAWRLPPLLSATVAEAAAAAAGELSGKTGDAGDGSDDNSKEVDRQQAGLTDRRDRRSGCEAVVFYELDSGAVERLKVEVLGQPAAAGICRRVFLAADLGGPPKQTLRALATAGHDALRPSVFVAEGLIGYLTTSGGDELLAALRSIAAPGSLLLLSAPPNPSWRDQLAAQGVRLHHVTYEDAEETRQRAQAAGWETKLLTASELGQKYAVPDNRFELIVATC